MMKLYVAYCLITLLFVIWGSGFIAEHTPCKNIWDIFVALGGVIFICWYSLMFFKVVFGI